MSTPRLRIFAGPNRLWLAEITDAKEIELKNDMIPFWFKEYILEAKK